VLLAGVAGDDPVALETLYDETSALVYSLARRVLRDQALAEDVTIDVYLQVSRQAASYDPDRGSATGWLLMLARSRALDRLRMEARKRDREVPLPPGLDEVLPSPASGPAEVIAQRELGRAVRSALAALSDEQRRVIEIAYFAGLSQSEIAARLGQPLGTVKSRMRTAMIRLRELLVPLLAECEA
jgi:RNA polymerase sigma-70 factor (ECF subfamily)